MSRISADSRPSVAVGDTALSIPAFFPSVSSVKTNLMPQEYVQILAATRQPAFLVSAYDIANSARNSDPAFLTVLRHASDKGAIILLDSGQYESYWLRDRTWTRERFRKTLLKSSFNIAFCYDNASPPPSPIAAADEIESGVLGDQRSSVYGTVVPIVHGEPDTLPETVALVAHRLHPLLLAVAERELGAGILVRAGTVFRIRSSLNSLTYRCPLHLLGTGNPLSIAIYVACGADTFDGLEWCQTAVDDASGYLHHFHLWDLFSSESEADLLQRLPYTQAVLLHNLLFYRRWLQALVNARRSGRVQEFVESYLASSLRVKLHKVLPEVF